MSTDVHYNGIELHNVVTRGWDQEVVYDDSETDLLFYRFRLKFEGILHVQGESISTSRAWIARGGGGGTTSSAAALMREIRAALGQPRGRLEVKIGGETALLCVPGTVDFASDPDRDVDNGPKPHSISVEHISGSQLFRVSFSVDCAKVECDYYGIGPSAVLSNRWSISEAMDDRFFTTRTISGRLRLSIATSAFYYKAMVVPGLEKGFRRDKFSFVVTANGLEADYEIMDVQTHTAAPWPAVKISGTHIESTGNGVDFFSEVSIRLEGAPDSDKQLLFAQGLKVADSRLNILTNVMSEHYLIEHAALIDHFGDQNAVEVRMRVRQYPKKDEELKDFLTNIYKEHLGTPIEIEPLLDVAYDRLVSPFPDLHGYDVQGEVRDPAAVLLLLRCYQQSPCSNAHGIQRGVYPDDTPEEEGKETPTEYEGATVPALPEDEYYNEVDSSSMAEGIYTFCRAETTYRTSPMRSQMPLARPSDAPASSDTSVVLTLARSICQREIIVDAERVGSWPMIPEPVDSYTDGDGADPITATLLNYWDKPMPPVLSADVKKKVFRIQAYYLYALSRPPTAAEKTRVGILPHTSHTADDTSITRGDVYQARLTPGGSSA